MTTKDPLGILGRTINGKYAIEAAVGEGGAAIVYRARNTEWAIPVALKFYVALSQAPEDQREKLLAEFVQEGRLMTHLSSRSAAIVQPRDMGAYTTDDGMWVPYLVLEWLAGAPLDAVLVAETERGTPPRTLEETLTLLEPVVEALDIAHGEGIVHRDIKPENMYLIGAPRDPSARLKILDFGIAKLMDKAGALLQTALSATPFTPHYGAPEQFSRAYGSTGPWTDVFALALVVLEVMRGGNRAFAGNDYMELSRQSRDEQTRPTPRFLRLVVNDDTEAVFARALAVQPAARYQRAGEFWVALNGAVFRDQAAPTIAVRHLSTNPPGTRSGAPPAAAGAGSAVTRPRSLVPFIAAGGVLAAAGIGLGVFLYVSRPSDPKPAGSGAASSGSASATTPVPSASSAALAPSASASAAASASCPPKSVIVHGGRVEMGDDAIANASPAHTAFVDAFCLDVGVVSADDYSSCVAAGACKKPSDAVADSPDHPKKPGVSCRTSGSEPVNCVDFDDASAYCAWRSMRLPTEAEWEYAARDRKFPDIGKAMSEWTHDLFGPYPEDPQVNPKGASTGDKRVTRGGPGVKNPAMRLPESVTFHHPDVGFRCARDAPK
ncbi:MAG: bifunctional serine/threonine-protein kinase/formylglycine-generating enzyme family protein [Polyangiaceae bacterium]